MRHSLARQMAQELVSEATRHITQTRQATAPFVDSSIGTVKQSLWYQKQTGSRRLSLLKTNTAVRQRTWYQEDIACANNRRAVSVDPLHVTKLCMTNRIMSPCEEISDLASWPSTADVKNGFRTTEWIIPRRMHTVKRDSSPNELKLSYDGDAAYPSISECNLLTQQSQRRAKSLRIQPTRFMASKCLMVLRQQPIFIYTRHYSTYHGWMPSSSSTSTPSSTLEAFEYVRQSTTSPPVSTMTESSQTQTQAPSTPAASASAGSAGSQSQSSTTPGSSSQFGDLPQNSILREPIIRIVRKSELAADTGLNLRDIRNVDPSFRQESPAILVRRKAIIVNMEHVRALLQADRMLLFDPTHPSVRSFIPELSYRLFTQNSHLPFELRALEAILINVCSSLHRHMSTLSPAVESVLDTLSTTSTTDFGSDSVQSSLDRLLPLENSLNEFLTKVTQLRQAFVEVLASDQDMSEMYLTSQKETGHRRRRDQHEEVEMMLENYLKQVDAVHNELTAILRAVKSTENVTQIRLDAMRNRVLRLEVYLNIATMSLTSGGLVAGLFGMNLLSGLEESPYAFPAVAVVALMVAVLAFRGVLGLLRYKRIFR